MQEFSSISVSSYEAGDLAARLTEQSRSGWEVVAIVPTGSTVTAYLSRAAGSDAAPAVAETVATETEHETTEPETTEPEPAAAEPEPHPEVEAEVDTPEQPEVEATPAEAATDEEIPVDEATPDADQGAGWASLVAEVAGTADDPVVPTLPSSAPGVVIEPEPATAAIEPEAAVEPVVAAEPAAEAAPASAAAPAGWYADPSSRFELRYWDGSQWTEHVSRAGQQYTDPPVA